MAKSEGPSPLEQHLEKGVLGASLLILVVALSLWGFSSPRRVSLGGRDAELNKVHEMILDAAQRRKKEADEQPPPKFNPLDFVKTAGQLLNQPLPDELVGAWPEGMALAGRPVQEKAPPSDYPKPLEVGESKPIFLAVKKFEEATPAPGRVAVKIDRELLYRPPELPEGIVAHCAAVYPAEELAKKWRDLFVGHNVPFLFACVAVEVERQERLPDGSWGLDGKADQAKLISTVTVNAKGEIKAVSQHYTKIPEFDGTEAGRNKIREATRTLQTENTFKELLEPEYGNIYWPSRKFGTWLVNLPENEVTRTAREARGARIDVPTYITPVQPIGTPPTVPLVPGTPYGPGFVPEEFNEPQPGMRMPPVRPGAVIPPTPRIPATPPAPPRTSGTHVTPKPGTPPVTPAAPLSPDPDVPPVPSLQQQMADGQLLVWFHDVSPEPRKEYRYRVRLALVNPLLSYDQEVEKRQDARQRLLKTPWSEWSEGYSVPEVMEMFLIGGSSYDQKVSITVFTQRLGQTLEGRFYLGAGQRVGGEQKIKYVNPHNPHPGAKEERIFNFDTGAVIVSLDFDKPATKDNVPRATFEMLYLDEKGQLRRIIRVDDMDRDSEMKKRYDELRTRVKSQGS